MTRVLVILAWFLLCGRVLAGPVQLERIGADTTWLVHADFDAMRSNAAGQEFLRIGADAIEEVAQEIRQELGVDLVSQVRSITIYGPTLNKRAGVMLIDVDPSADISRFLEGEGAENSLVGNDETDREVLEGSNNAKHNQRHNDSRVRVIADEKRQRWYIARKSRDARNVFVVGDDQDTVLRAADVLDGARASMRTSVVLGLLGPSIGELPSHEPAPLVQGPQWPFDKLPSLISDHVMLTIAIAQMPVPVLDAQGGKRRPLPTIAHVKGVLARLGEIRDEVQTPWLEADISLRMQTEDAAESMENLVSVLLEQLKNAMPVADGQAPVDSGQNGPGHGVEVARTGTDVRVRAKERLEEAVAGLSGGQANGAIEMLRLLQQSHKGAAPAEQNPAEAPEK